MIAWGSRLIRAATRGLPLAAAAALAAGVVAPPAAAAETARTAHAVRAPASSAIPAASTNSGLDSLWNDYGNNAGCAQWSGGDATNSIVLPNGERAWFFSDTYLGSPAARKTLFYYSSIRNSVVMQNGSSLQTLTGGNTCQEQNQSLSFWDRYAHTPATESAHKFDWTGDQIVDSANGRLIKFYYGGDSLTTSSVFAPEVASIPLSQLESPQTDSSGNPVISITLNAFNGCTNGPAVVWGASLLNSGGHIYVYGWLNHRMYLARVPSSNVSALLNQDFSGWDFYDGSGFTGSCTAAAPLAAPVHDADFSVVSINGSFWAIEDDGAEIVAYPGSAPQSLGSGAVTLVPSTGIPENGNTGGPYYEYHYAARLQPGLTDSSGDYVISYNVNTFSVDTGCVSANNHDASIYRPRFLYVPASAFAAASAAAAKAARPAGAASRAAARQSMAATLYGQSIHNSGPFRLPHGAVPAAPKARAKPAPAGRAAAGAAASSGSIDGSTDWFDKGFGASCPAVPTASGLSDSPQPDGTVNLTWSNAGTDVWFYGYQCDASTSTCTESGTRCQAGNGYSDLWGGLWATAQPGTNPSQQAIPISTQSQVGNTFDWYVCSFGAGYNTTDTANTASPGGNSNVASAAVTIAPPSAPTGVGSYGSSGLGEICWTDVTYPSGSVYYTLYYWDTNTQTESDAQAFSPPMPPGTTSAQVGMANSGDTYGFYLTAANLGGTSPKSAVVYLTPNFTHGCGG